MKNSNEQIQLLKNEKKELLKRIAELETKNRALQLQSPNYKSAISLQPITKKVFMAVEGKDDKNFVDAFLKHLAIDPKIYQIEEIAGNTKYQSTIPTLVKTSGFMDNVKALIIIRDADEDPNATFQSLTHLITKIGLQPPNNPNEYSNGNPSVGLFIMPGKGLMGALESLALKTVEKDPITPLITKFLEDIQKLPNIDLGSNNEIDKRKAQIYLATRLELVYQVGLAAQKGYFDFDDLSEELQAFKEFCLKINNF